MLQSTRPRGPSFFPAGLAFVSVLVLSACTSTPQPPSEPGPAESPRDRGASPTGGINAPEHRLSESLVLISFDGFRHDYLDRYPTPAFDRVAERGALAEGLIPPFPSKTFPSHYTLVTGLYPEHHGIVGNRFYDPRRDEIYQLGDSEAVEDGTWYSGEPVWAAAERQGMVAASYFWVGSEADIGGVRPTEWFSYSDEVTGEEKVDTVLSWLARPRETRPRMITLYFPDVDQAGHDAGPDSPEVAEAVERVDRWLDRLVRGITLLDEGDRVNLVLVSDHGMAELSADSTHVLDLTGFPDARVVADGTYASIFVEGGAERAVALRDQLAAGLPDRVGVHLREDVPERLHYSATRRVGDIVVVPPLGHGVYEPARRPTRSSFTHGWDPAAREMHGIFLAAGPRITEGARLRGFEAIHVYPFLLELLGLQSPDVDGSLEVLGSLILEDPR